MKYIKVTLKGVAYIDTVEGVKTFIEEIDCDGNKYTLEAVEILEEELITLPEFKGF